MNTSDNKAGVAPASSIPFSFNEARLKLSVAGHAIQHVIKTRPLMALGVSLGLGVALGWLGKRR